jgi:hypothetical protein
VRCHLNSSGRTLSADIAFSARRITQNPELSASIVEQIRKLGYIG